MSTSNSQTSSSGSDRTNEHSQSTSEKKVNAMDVYRDESGGDKFKRKFKENPFFPIAAGGAAAGAAYGLYNIRNRGNTPLSMYLIHLRVGAQGFAVGTLALGVFYSLGKRLYNMSQGIEEEYDPNRGR